MLKTDFGADRITVTSALPYVNGVKHLGNLAGSILPADIFHRFLDLLNIPNIYICGTDNHGTPSVFAALKAGMDIKDYANKYYKVQKEIYEKWNFDFTFFGHTSSKTHKELSQKIFLSQYENGLISENELLLPFCKHCQHFLPDRFVYGTCPSCGYENARGDQCESCGAVLDPYELKKPHCNICNSTDIEFKKEKHLFLKFNELSNQLEKWILSNKHWPSNTRNFALGWLKEGLNQRCITRNMNWGIQVPLKKYQDLVFYVWYEAPIGYISITKEAIGEKEWEKWWKDPKTKIYHFLGKDNVPFHTIFWPGIILAAKGNKETTFQLPYHVAGYEYLNWEGSKFSTSKSIGLFSDEALDIFPSDYWRFYLAAILPEKKDSNFEWKDFQNRINNELIANFGNLFYRVTTLIEKHFAGKVPEPKKWGQEEKELEKELEKLIINLEKLVKDIRLKEALYEIMGFSSKVNAYLQEKAPWAPKEKETPLYAAANCLKTIATLLWPYTPEASEKALGFLNTEKDDWEQLKNFNLKPGQTIKSAILFKKIEKIPNKEKEAKKMVSIKDFEKLDLRIATIEEVEDHPNADSLYLLKIDVGGEKRQLVAGLKDAYPPENLKGKQIVIIHNLEPATIRGQKSEGMLLATKEGILLKPDKQTDNGKKIM